MRAVSTSKGSTEPTLATTAAPEAVGLSSARLEAAASVYESAIGAPDGVSAASMVVLRRGQVVLARGFGRVAPQPEAAAVEPSSVFMLASITKPVTAMALLLLVEEGRLSLEDPACLHLPEFSEGERASITVRDLLAHTSGLPDMLPENMALREARAPLSDFVAKTLTTPLLFTPGTDFSYQSMGILLAATIVERLTGQPMRDFMCAPAPFATCPAPTPPQAPHPTHPQPLVCSPRTGLRTAGGTGSSRPSACTTASSGSAPTSRSTTASGSGHGRTARRTARLTSQTRSTGGTWALSTTTFRQAKGGGSGC